MWASAGGHDETVCALYRWSPGSAAVCAGGDGLTPEMLAKRRGHSAVVEQLQQLERSRQLGRLHPLAPAATKPPYYLVLPKGTSLSSAAPLLTQVSTGSQYLISSASREPPPRQQKQPTIVAAAAECLSNSSWPSNTTALSELSIEIPAQTDANISLQPPPPRRRRASDTPTERRRSRLMKRISVEVLPDYPQQQLNDPMISMNNRDLNSPVMFLSPVAATIVAPPVAGVVSTGETAETVATTVPASTDAITAMETGKLVTLVNGAKCFLDYVEFNVYCGV